MKDMADLSAGEYSVSVVGKQEMEGDKISSTRIRGALKEGNVEDAKELLGRPFMLTGVVVHGDKRGRTIDFPTANIQPKEGQFIPAIGVYAVKIRVQEQWYEGVCNVGYKPTFNNPDEKNCLLKYISLTLTNLFMVKKWQSIGTSAYVLSKNSVEL